MTPGFPVGIMDHTHAPMLAQQAFTNMELSLSPLVTFSFCTPSEGQELFLLLLKQLCMVNQGT